MKETKICTVCKIHKALDSFTKRSTVKSGLDSWCIECKSKIRKKYYKAGNEHKHKNICPFCGKDFLSTKQDSVHCSHSCASKNASLLRNPNRIKNRSNGYVALYCVNKCGGNRDVERYEHRVVMEKHINRKLKKGEVIHHIDGDRKNNSIENLMLFKSNSEHIKYHARNK